MMTIKISEDKEYQSWFADLKERFRISQIKAAVQVNQELLYYYWHLGLEILEKQKRSNWGDALIKQLSADFANSFPGMKGFSRSNLFYIRKWVDFYNVEPIVQQAVGQLAEPASNIDFQQFIFNIPWGQNVSIVTKCSTVPEALYYAKATIQNNWSRAVLEAQIESGLFHRKGAAIDNFSATLTTPQADLARETLKNPYNFEFLTFDQNIYERDLENAMVAEIQKLLLELGQGFAYMGRQYALRIGHSEFFLDLLFYHTRLRCYIVVEIKVTPFQPEFTGKLNFYLNAVDAQLKHPSDEPSIGILLCKTPDNIVAEYSLKNINSPIGVASYHLTKSLPLELKEGLPSVEELTARLTDQRKV